MAIVRALLLRASRSKWLEAQFRKRKFAQRAVRRFMPGEDLESAYAAAADFGSIGLGTVFTQLGERTDSRANALEVRDHYLGVLQTIRQRKLPAVISVKLTHLGLSIDRDVCKQSLIALAQSAAQDGAIVWVDMEESQYVDPTLEVFRSARAERPNLGLCLQAYLHRTPADLASLLADGTPVRLVKGAYREPREIAYAKKKDTDRAYAELSEEMLKAAAAGRGLPVFGTHDLRLIDHIREFAGTLRMENGKYEVHMLYGIKSAEQRALAAAGVKVRVLISYGTHWFPWYVRRLAERPANVWFVAKNIFSR